MVSYGYFHLPKAIKVRNAEENNVDFEWSPFERGFGHTIGNSMRRVLLSSITAPAIISIKISSFCHEFMAAEGIIEDMTDISMNFKEVLIKAKDSNDIEAGDVKVIEGTFEIGESDIDSNEPVQITAGDIIVHEDIEVLNPKKVLFTITKPKKIDFKIKFAMGRGYMPIDKSILKGKEEDGEVLMDGLFSPVRLVNCKVENSRVGSSTDYDKLILKVETDGRITPHDALNHGLQITSHFFSNIEQVSSSTIIISEDDEDSVDKVKVQEDEKMLQVFSKKIPEMDFTVRASNCLKDVGVLYFGELLLKDEEEMLNIKNLGKKSLDELRSRIQEQGQEHSVYLYFGMDLSKYGITKENAREFFNELSEEKVNIG